MPLSEQTLGIVSAMYASWHDGGVYIHLSFGRVIDRLAARAARTILCVPIQDGAPPESRDYRIQARNLEVVRQPYYTSSMGALRHAIPITRAYARVCREADAVFIRGMVPYVQPLYALALWHRRRPCHWIVGNPIALLKTHRRAGWATDMASLLYARQDQVFTRLGRRLTGGAFVCNGRELGEVFKSPRTAVTVSSTVTDDEFHERSDTCQTTPIRILFIGIPRPEKGLQYLLEALARLNTEPPCELTIVGASEQFRGYREELEQLTQRLGIAARVHWVGYATYGPPMFRYLRSADLLVLPTLSEGTPRVLIEARANSLPIVASNVGGIPTSVTDGLDGLLVPPKDPVALAGAIGRIINDGELRRSLINNGRRTARTMTVDRFADVVVKTLEAPGTESRR